MIRIKNCHILNIELPVNGFKWVEGLSKFDERFIKL